MVSSQLTLVFFLLCSATLYSLNWLRLTSTIRILGHGSLLHITCTRFQVLFEGVNCEGKALRFPLIEAPLLLYICVCYQKQKGNKKKNGKKTTVATAYKLRLDLFLSHSPRLLSDDPHNHFPSHLPIVVLCFTRSCHRVPWHNQCLSSHQIATPFYSKS